VINTEDDTMPEYFRIVDQLYCWGYWMSALLVAEVIVCNLPPVTGTSEPETTTTFTSPLLRQNNSTTTQDQPTAEAKNYKAVERKTEHPTVEASETSSASVINGSGVYLLFFRLPSRTRLSPVFWKPMQLPAVEANDDGYASIDTSSDLLQALEPLQLQED
jgi:hypothetical protein